MATKNITRSNPKSPQINITGAPLRQLTVRGKHYEYQHKMRPTPPEVPFIELSGYWLQQAGFEIGHRVKVVPGDGYLLIVGIE